MVESAVKSHAEIVVDSTEKLIRVLHVDDEPALLKVAKQSLEMQGPFQVDTADSVEEALNKLKEKEYDAVVSNYQMRGKDSLEFLKELREENNDIPFIIFTEKGREELAIKELLNLNADGYFEKHGEPEAVYRELAHGISEAVEKKRIRDALRSSQAKHKSLLQNIPGMVYRAQPDWSTEIIANSKSVCGYTIQEFDSRRVNWLDIIHPDDKARVVKEGGIILEGPASITQEYRIVDKESGVRWVEDHKTSFFSKNGVFEGIDGIVFDVTSRKKTEQALHASLDRYQSFIEVTEDLGWTTNANGEVLADIPSFRRFTGQTYEKVKGWGWSKALHPDDLERTTRIWEEATRTKSKYEVEYRLRRHDGDYRYFMARSVPVFNEDGSIREWVGTCIDITERKAMEDALRKSEKRLRMLLENLPQKIFLKDRNSVYISCNENYAQDLKIHPNEITGKTDYDFYPEPLAERYRADDKKIVESGKTKEIEEEYIQNGQEVIVQTVKTPVKDENGHVVGILGIFWDITKRKNVERTMMQIQQKFEALFKNNPEAAAHLDMDFRVLDVNPRFCQLFGYSANEAKGKHMFELVVPEDKTGEAETLYEEAKKGYSYYDTVRRRKDGSRLPVSISTAPITVEDKLSGYVIIYKDITELKRAQEESEESRRHFQMLFDLMADPVAVVDGRGKILEVTQKVEEITGFKKEELVGKNLLKTKMFGAKTKAVMIKKLAERMMGMHVEPYGVEVLRKDGGKLMYEINAAKIDYKGKPADLVVFRDILERKNLEEKLRVVGSLTRHDVRNKLCAVTGNAYLLRRKLAGNLEALEQLADMENAVRNVEAIFEFARTYEKLGVEQLVNMNVGKAVDEAASLFPDLKGIRIANECGGLTVLADSLLRQLFYNLIDDSLKYGEKLTQIRVRYEEFEDKLKLIYEDDGVGISRDAKSKLFNEGFTTGKGSGYGLYLIRRIMEVYGWTISETGTHGKGAQFTINIPKAKPDGR